jgi:hypothetical protein
MGRLSQGNYLNSGVQDQCGQKSKTPPILLSLKKNYIYRCCAGAWNMSSVSHRTLIRLWLIFLKSDIIVVTIMSTWRYYWLQTQHTWLEITGWFPNFRHALLISHSAPHHRKWAEAKTIRLYFLGVPKKKKKSLDGKISNRSFFFFLLVLGVNPRYWSMLS